MSKLLYSCGDLNAGALHEFPELIEVRRVPRGRAEKNFRQEIYLWPNPLSLPE